MPTGPRGEKRPPDVIANAVMVAKIATGEVEDTCAKPAQAGTEQRPKPPDTARSEKQPSAGHHVAG